MGLRDSADGEASHEMYLSLGKRGSAGMDSRVSTKVNDRVRLRAPRSLLGLISPEIPVRDELLEPRGMP